jgi:ectoine hydroxylase-related dioxygenase (phytanoyl-CoA dioxygenase family)
VTIEFYDTDLFTAAEVGRYGRALEDVLRRKRNGADYDGTKLERATPLEDDDPDAFRPLLDDDRLLAIADGLLGPDCLYTGSNDGNLYTGNTVWHIDGGSPDAAPMLKLTLYCEPVAEGKGCLSVLPGSHHPAYFRELYKGFYGERALPMTDPNVPGRTPVPSEPGDVIGFDHRLWHSSWGGHAGRRQLAFSFASYPHDSWEETALHGYLARVNKRHGKRLLSDGLLHTAGERRRKKIAKLYEMGL